MILRFIIILDVDEITSVLAIVHGVLLSRLKKHLVIFDVYYLAKISRNSVLNSNVTAVFQKIRSWNYGLPVFPFRTLPYHLVNFPVSSLSAAENNNGIQL